MLKDNDSIETPGNPGLRIDADDEGSGHDVHGRDPLREQDALLNGPEVAV